LLFGATVPSKMETQETADLPGSWRTLRDGLPGSWTPVGPTCQAIRHADAAPGGSTARAPTRKLSRLDVQAFHLAVYASSGGSPHQDARLASGCWPALPGGIRTRRVPTEGFRVV